MATGALRTALDATWPPAAWDKVGPFLLRHGAGGGSRVSAATCEGPWTEADLARAEAQMSQPLFMIRSGDAQLDAALEARGYQLSDPTQSYLFACRDLAMRAQGVTYTHWPPLAIQKELWDQGGIGPARQDIMDRAAGPKASLLARLGQGVAGAGFVACAPNGLAMVHAVHVVPEDRRRGVARALMAAAADWAGRQGAQTLAVLVTIANDPANALYQGLGGTVGPGYHYRVASEAA